MNMAVAQSWPVLRYGDRVAVKTPSIERTFSEIDARANALANALLALGVSKGDAVGLLVGNDIEYVEADIAIAKAGAVRVSMLVSSSPSEIERYIWFAETRVVIVGAEPRGALDEAVAGLREAGKPVPAVIAVGPAGPGEHRYEELIARASSVAPETELSDSDLYAIRFTGGTTGLPKGVLMDHRCGVALVNNMLLNWNIGVDESICLFHPLSHAAGMFLATFYVRGARTVLMPSFDFEAERLYGVIEQERITSLFMVPTVLNLLLDCPTRADFDSSSLRRIVYGGAPISPERVREAVDLFGPVLTQVYGSSESPVIATTLLPEDHAFVGQAPGRLASAGRPGYNVEVRLVNQADQDCAPGEIGEILIRGDHTFSGYLKDPELSAERLRDGWVHSADMGAWDDDGYLYIVDRKDDMIITGGFNVWPAEVENVLGGHPDVGESVVVGIPDDRWGEMIVAVVVSRPGCSANPDELIAFVRERMTSYKVPKRVIVRAEPLPKSAVGKLLRRRVRDQYAEGVARS